MFQKLWPFNSTTNQNGTSQINESKDHGISTKVKPVYASFNKGIPLNMKIVIRGDIRTGKTSLFERLQGLPFGNEHDYQTTAQIQVANIPWQYPHTKDIIKVEVWDVVDKGVQSADLKTSSTSALKIDNNIVTSPTQAKPVPDIESVPHAGFALDASTIDVYRNTNGVILIYDISKPWTFDYAAKALEEMPTNIPVLILSNFTDDTHPRPVVASDRVEALMKEHNDARYKLPCAPANLVRHLESSMKTGLGLKEVHESFGIPFLNVLRETHRKQFEQKTLEIGELLHALDGHTRDRSSRQFTTKKTISTVTSSKTATSTKKLVPAPVTIQTSGPSIHPGPRTLSPTSPGRKTRNDHTNVDILSPTPVSVHTPAVLFEFNSGKLEDDFFQTGDTEPEVSSVPEHSPSVVNSSQEIVDSVDEEEDGGNPMVARDEDIGDSSRDEREDGSPPNPIQAPIWTPGQVEAELKNRHMVKGSDEMKMEEIEDAEDDDYRFGEDFNQDDFEPVEDSDQSIMDIVPPFRLSFQQDSDVESQSDYPIASAMYYEHDDPSGFMKDTGIRSDPLPASVLSGYEEIADEHSGNPWNSTSDLLRGTASAPKNGALPSEETPESDHDVEKTTAAEVEATSTAVDSDKTSNGMEGMHSQIADVDTEADPALINDDANVDAVEVSPTPSIQTNGVNDDDVEDNDNKDSPIASNDVDKKKTKKKNKKKGKKGR
ncbi:Rab-like protein 6 [Mortierella polycephala]|uniref:Rab-like protein 6 n=1 Tax=Mortierella polycephala TaxID=41804 RepID=A0A9P6Q627_9FUNG|nr:Rab-like protein 6 [Mortierella polycephala]